MRPHGVRGTLGRQAAVRRKAYRQVAPNVNRVAAPKGTSQWGQKSVTRSQSAPKCGGSLGRGVRCGAALNVRDAQPCERGPARRHSGAPRVGSSSFGGSPPWGLLGHFSVGRLPIGRAWPWQHRRLPARGHRGRLRERLGHCGAGRCMGRQGRTCDSCNASPAIVTASASLYTAEGGQAGAWMRVHCARAGDEVTDGMLSSVVP